MKNIWKNSLTLFLVAALLATMIVIPVNATPSGIWDGSVAASFAGGDGTEANPYQIATASQLALLASYIGAGNSAYNSKSYVLTEDIYLNDISNYDNWATQQDGLKEWGTPIGNDWGYQLFQGTFNGCGHTVYGVFIKSNSTSYVGLFGFAYNATIKNLRVAYSYYCTDNAACFIGGIVARLNGGTVENCSSDVDITINGSGTDLTVGGIVGSVPNAAGAVIRNCANAGNIYVKNSGTWTNIGGILGAGNSGTANDGLIENCYNIGNVYHDSAVTKSCGGILGFEGGDTNGTFNIRNCYNTGTITGGTINTGGICGFVRTSATFSNCYNLGETNGRQIRGDVYNATLTLENCYYNSDLPAIPGGTGAIGLSVSAGEFVSENISFPELAGGFSGDVWNVASGEAVSLKNVPARVTTYNPSAPVWNGTVASEFAGGDGTEADPFRIATGEQLALLSKYVNESNTTYSAKTVYYVLTNDIYLNDVSDYANWTPSTEGLHNWTPIGESGEFYAQFDGQNHSVYGMYINTSFTKSGLFGYVNGYDWSGATIVNGVKNVNVVYSYICACPNYYYGGISGRTGNGVKIEHCSTDVKVVFTSTGNVNVGGIVGYAANGSNAIVDCANYGEITVTGNMTNNYVGVGGIVGGMNDSNVKNSKITGCLNAGAVTYNNASGRGVGGIAGYVGDADNNACITVSDCMNTGAIATDQVADGSTNMGSAGIVGRFRTTSVVKNCINIGTGAAFGIYGQDNRNNSSFINNFYLTSANVSAGPHNGTATGVTAITPEALGMTAIWNLTDGKLPALCGVPNPIDVEVLGAQIREKRTEFYRNGAKVAEGQGILFGVAVNDYEKYMEAGALKSGYTAGLLISTAGSLNGAALTYTNAEYKIQASNTLAVEDGVLNFSGYLVGIDAANFNTEFVARAYLMKDGVVFMYSDSVTRSIQSVADALGRELDAYGNLTESISLYNIVYPEGFTYLQSAAICLAASVEEKTGVSTTVVSDQFATSAHPCVLLGETKLSALPEVGTESFFA